MFASLQIHGQILGRRALSIRPQGFASIALGCLLVAGLAGCGQKGPLFLPGPPPPLQTRASPNLAPAPNLTDAPNLPAATPQ